MRLRRLGANVLGEECNRRLHGRSAMKYMILTIGSQRDYQKMVGQPSGEGAWTKEDYSALGEFMRSLSQELLDSGELVFEG
jgi:hypothetical protein